MNLRIIGLGYGHHVMTVPPQNLVTIIEYSFVTGILLVWSVTLSKMSVAVMLLRLQPGKAWTWTMSIAIFALAAVLLIFTGIEVSQCKPMSSAWKVVLNHSLASNCKPETEVWPSALSTSSNPPASLLPFLNLPFSQSA